VHEAARADLTATEETAMRRTAPESKSRRPDVVPLRVTALDARGYGVRGATAMGAFAVGATALGAVAIGRIVIGRAAIKRLVIDDLEVRRLRVHELEVESERRAPEGTGGSSAPGATA
jgi:hypothetical protein